MSFLETPFVEIWQAISYFWSSDYAFGPNSYFSNFMFCHPGQNQGFSSEAISATSIYPIIVSLFPHAISNFPFSPPISISGVKAYPGPGSWSIYSNIDCVSIYFGWGGWDLQTLQCLLIVVFERLINHHVHFHGRVYCPCSMFGFSIWICHIFCFFKTKKVLH